MRRMEFGEFSIDGDATSIGSIKPGQDGAERRLPSSILTQQRVDFAPLQIEIYAVVCDDAVERLPNPAQFNARSTRISVTIGVGGTRPSAPISGIV